MALLLTVAAAAAAASKQILFQLHDSGDEDPAFVARALGKEVGLRPERVFRHAGRYEKRHITHGLDRWYEAVVDDAAGDTMVHKLLSEHASVVGKAAMRPERRMLNSGVRPNDPRYMDQPGMPAVGLEEAWGIIPGGVTRDGEDVVVAVVDSGIDMTHEDLRLNQWSNPGEVCGNGVDDDGNGFVDDCRGYNFGDDTGTQLEGDGSHGTHCAGVVSADTNNSLGVAGTAGGAAGGGGAKLMILTVFGKFDTKGFAEAIVYGADNGASISSNSWGNIYPGAPMSRQLSHQTPSLSSGLEH